MKTSAVKTVLTTFVLVLMTLTGSSAYSLDSREECRANPHDPHSEGIVMLRGKYQGQCMDTSFKRAVKVLSLERDLLTISNYRKGGKFYTAEIPLQELEKVSYLVVDLNAKPINAGGLVNISHTELRFKFKHKDSIRLLPQDPSDRTLTDGDLVISYNYMAPKKVEYSPVKGFDEDLYGAVLQFFSMEDEAKTRFVDHKLNVYEMALSVKRSQAMKILVHAAKDSEKMGYASAYDTWTNNCTTKLYDILDAALGSKAPPYRFSVKRIGDTGMAPGILALGKRGLLAPEGRVTLVNHEFGYKKISSWSGHYFGYWLGKTYKDVEKTFWVRK